MIDEDVARITALDVRDEATDDEADLLREDRDSVAAWKKELVRLVQAADAKLTRIKADVATREQQSRASGPKAKAGFFQWKATKEHERAEVMRLKAMVVTRITEANEMLHQFAQEPENNASHHAITTRLDRIEASLALILAKVCQ